MKTIEILRYLLADSICNLLMLEMLILSGCAELETLPKGLRKLISLVHLEITVKQCVLPEDQITNLSLQLTDKGYKFFFSFHLCIMLLLKTS